MKMVLQRVREAAVTVNGSVHGSIGNGLVVLLGIGDADTDEDAGWLCQKIIQLRIFNDPQGMMNKSVQDIGGGILVVSQFTLMASTKKGNRPSYSRAGKPEIAEPLYNSFLTILSHIFAGKIGTGVFGADMQLSLINDGPVTIILDTKNKE
jgi:D-tyrosyl-tRNA(Tyr) deacylase